jgi:hypothetical protein
VAVGAGGVEAFSLVDPEMPVSVSLIDFGDPVVSVSASDGLVWGANHDAVAVADASNPESPVPLGTHPTEEWAMHVHAEGATAFVADWGRLEAYTLDRDLRAPAVSVNRAELLVVAGTTDTLLTVTNRGGAPLQIGGSSVDDPRFSLLVEKTTLAPGESAGIKVLFAEDGESISATLCLATNDPGEPVLRVPISSSADGAAVGIGEPAPDFVLRDLEGNNHQLSAQLGHPVVLSYFATW